MTATEPKTRAAIIGIVTLALLGIGTLTLFAKTLPARLKAPFGSRQNSAATGANLGGLTSPEEDLTTATKDTDRDGIPDLHELRVYKTSPFLEDSDSDGVGDKAEIDAGEDPNCPKGTDCRTAFALPSAGDVQKAQIADTLYRSTVIAKLEQSGLPGLTDAAAIRGFLRQGGISEAVLRQFDDATLLQLFNESSRAAGSAPLLNPPPQVGGGSAEGISTTSGGGAVGGLPTNPTPQAVRALLLSSGLDPKILEAIDDQTLMRLYGDALREIQNAE